MSHPILNVLTAGFAIFSMFFGSGNLVFPLQVGVDSKAHFLSASGGLLITGVLLPILGLLSVIVSGDGGRKVLYRIGKIPGFILIFMMLSLMGPFGVGARCILVAYGGMQLVFPNLQMIVFSVLFVCATGWIIWQKDTFVAFVGRYLSPILIIGLIVIISVGILSSNSMPTPEGSPLKPFKEGFLRGYMMMDLLAAFFFSGTIMAYFRAIRERGESNKSVLMHAASASLIGMVLLLAVYLGFVTLGAIYADSMASIPGEQMLTFISGQVLGVFAMPMVALVVMLACLTTLVVLVNLFAEFLHQDMLRERINRHVCIAITLGLTFMTSLLGFNALAAWIGAALTIAYPALIVLAVLSIAHDLLKMPLKYLQGFFYLALVLCIAHSVFSSFLS